MAAEAWHLLAEGTDLGAGLAFMEAADSPLQALLERKRLGGGMEAEIDFQAVLLKRCLKGASGRRVYILRALL